MCKFAKLRVSCLRPLHNRIWKAFNILLKLLKLLKLAARRHPLQAGGGGRQQPLKDNLGTGWKEYIATATANTTSGAAGSAMLGNVCLETVEPTLPTVGSLRNCQRLFTAPSSFQWNVTTALLPAAHIYPKSSGLMDDMDDWQMSVAPQHARMSFSCEFMTLLCLLETSTLYSRNRREARKYGGYFGIRKS